MKGIELSEQYYLTYGKPMLESEFPALLPLIAVGAAGPGSEWLGFDDDVSTDHDFGPGFTIFLPDESEVSRRDAFLLERAYQKLPDTFLGYQRERLSPAGGNRFGVVRRSDFFQATTGTPDGFLSVGEWLSIPEQSLLEATNGKLFYDGDGVMSAIRNHLSSMDEDVRLKKLVGSLFVMGQSGRYNYDRILKHGEPGSAMLSFARFAEEALHTAYLLNHRYMPYYKWSFRGARALQKFAPDFSAEALAEALANALTGRADVEETIERVEQKTTEAVLADLSEHGYVSRTERSGDAANPYRLRETGISDDEIRDLGSLCERVNACISDPSIRNLHVLSGVTR